MVSPDHHDAREAGALGPSSSCGMLSWLVCLKPWRILTSLA